MKNNLLSPLLSKKLTALFCCLMSFLLAVCSYSFLAEVEDYQPMPKQVFLDVYSRPIGDQSLLSEVKHSMAYRSETEGQSAGDFAKEALLYLFSYSKDELASTEMYRRHHEIFSDVVADDVYLNVFSLLSHQKIVMAQDAIVRARVIGDLYYEGRADWNYESTAGLDLKSATFKLTGQVMITVHASEIYPTLYKVELIVQRALVQDKIRGYQLIELRLK